MSSDTQISPPLSPHLYESIDDEYDLLWKVPMNDLINNTVTPFQAAQNLDTIIRNEAFTRLQDLHSYATEQNLFTEDGENAPSDLDEWGGLPPPNASALADTMMRAYVRVCQAFAPYSNGQNRIIQFLRELKGLPRWMAPCTIPDAEGDTCEKEFWDLGLMWCGWEDEWRREHIHVKPGYYRDDAAHKRWRNFQHTMARLTSLKLIYCAPWNALSDLVRPENSQSKKPNLEYDIVAAVQWVIWPKECRHVYRECLKKPITTFYWEPWSVQSWGQWKEVFEGIGGNAVYDDETRGVAREAVRKMREVEEEIGDGGSGSGSE